MEVWLVKYSDGGDFCGTFSVHKTRDGAETMKTYADKEEEDNGLVHYVTGPYELKD